ncbi:MAG: hypothetical protein LBB40_02570 [Holophagales bacterium]|nr:hypothetical protein [Holophagales bacterium]
MPNIRPAVIPALQGGTLGYSGLKERLRCRIRSKAGVSNHSVAEIKIAERNFDAEAMKRYII